MWKRKDSEDGTQLQLPPQTSISYGLDPQPQLASKSSYETILLPDQTSRTIFADEREEEDEIGSSGERNALNSWPLIEDEDEDHWHMKQDDVKPDLADLAFLNEGNPFSNNSNIAIAATNIQPVASASNSGDSGAITNELFMCPLCFK